MHFRLVRHEVLAEDNHDCLVDSVDREHGSTDIAPFRVDSLEVVQIRS